MLSDGLVGQFKSKGYYVSKDDVTKRFKPVWNLQLAVERNIDHKGMEKLQELYNALGRC